MSKNRALAAIYFTLILCGLVHAQQLSPAILRAIPDVSEKLNSKDIYERVSVLEKLVVSKQTTHLPQLEFPYDLPATDYAAVVQSVLGGNLDQVEDRRASDAWWKIYTIVWKFKLKLPGKLVSRYLTGSDLKYQLVILRIIRMMQAVDSVPEIMPLLQAPDERIRREALETLVALHAKEAVPFLVALLRDSDAGQRSHAVDNLVKLNAREAAVDVVKMLEDPYANNRFGALDALVKWNAREHAQAVWKLTEAGQGFTDPAQQRVTQEYALAALIYFGERRAIPLAIKLATGSDMTRRHEMLDFVVQIKATAIVPALIAVLESNTVLGDNPEDKGTDSNIRRDLMQCLGRLQAREAIPVLRGYARGRESNTFLQIGAAEELGVLRAKESVDDLLALLDKSVKGDEYGISETGLALAQIGERRTWRKLIDLAARPACFKRSEIISELNQHLDPELWTRVQAQKVSGLYIRSVKATVEIFSRQSGIPIVLDYQPGKDLSRRNTLEADGYPWANTSVEEISLSYGLGQIVDGLSDYRTPRTYTFVFDDKQIHIWPMERAIEWWRKEKL